MLIVLMGYMGCGKSSVGKMLAAENNIPFIDLDDYIEEKEQQTVQEIFKTKGEIFFRKLETVSLESLLSASEGAVISLGGGTPCYGNNIEIIQNKASHNFYLKASIETLTERLVKEKEHRPLIKNINNDELSDFIRKHLFERNFFYMQAGNIITVDDKSIPEVVLEIQQQLS
ncbi:shikimate kinase [Zhouia sp. PK063]|uniref:shikimate kinase n=1 Tax=Zhouia sp. PK063 TaxID=3373602 RepID=UPI00378FDB39